MSDNISTVSTNLSNASNLISCQNMITNSILIILLICIISILFSMIGAQGQSNCSLGSMEYFSNFLKNKKEFDQQTIDLTAPDTKIGTPSSLAVAKCNRYVNGSDVSYEIYANLYLLNGNIYAKEVIDDHYSVYLVNETTSEKILLGNLTLDTDKVYKLKKTTNEDSLQYKHMYIVYSYDKTETISLVGKFR
jgi:hypothetical protein